MRNESLRVVLAFATAMCLAPALANGQSAPNAVCTGTIIGGTYRNVVVPGGATCKLSGVHVTGNIKVQPTGALQLYAFRTSGNTIDGSVQADGARWIVSGWLPGNTIAGSLQISKTAGVPFGDNTADDSPRVNYICRTAIGESVQIEESEAWAGFNVGAFSGPPGVAACTGINTVGGSIQVEENGGEMWIGNNGVDRNLLASDNALIHIFSNTIGGSLRCEDNSQLDGGGNATGSTRGQCGGF